MTCSGKCINRIFRSIGLHHYLSDSEEQTLLWKEVRWVGPLIKCAHLGCGIVFAQGNTHLRVAARFVLKLQNLGE